MREVVEVRVTFVDRVDSGSAFRVHTGKNEVDLQTSKNRLHYDQRKRQEDIRESEGEWRVNHLVAYD